jgi:hypothetical protein
VQPSQTKPAEAGSPQGAEFESDAARVNALHAQIETQDKDNLARAIEIGKSLIPIRERLKDGKRGTWLDWVKAKLKFSDNTALKYIKVAELSSKNLLANVVGLNEAYAVLRKAFPGRRRANRSRELARTVLYRRETLTDFSASLGKLNGGKSDIPAVQLTAANLSELTARLKFVAEQHGKALVAEPVTVIVVKMQQQGAQ